ncbi:hypothetical protein [Elioraea sp.]|uniref:hypothetical protein n=1 Tax=Elioraea sp. TaxID=2185103 RepID=UPI003F6EAD82
MAALLACSGGARADEAAAARLLWECRAMASVLIGSVTDAKSVMDELAFMGPEERPRERLVLHDKLQRSLVRSEMAASALVRLICPNRTIIREFDGDLRRAWAAMAANRQSVLRAIPTP